MPDIIVSIGTNCEISFNIRNTFQFERAFPFDWWFTPIQSVAAILRDRFDLQINDENLVHVRTPESILNTKYGFLHHHDFPREAEERIRADWRAFIPTIAEKYRALSERFLTDVGQARHALLVVNGDGGHKAYTATRSVDEAVYLDIAAAARNLFPQTRITLAVFNSSDGPIEAALRAAAVDGSIIVAPPVTDYGDRAEKARFAKSLRGWSEALVAVWQAAQSQAHRANTAPI